MMKAATSPEQLDIGAILTAPTKDPAWLTKCLVMGALTLVPIFGSLNLSGWTKAVADARARGETTLPAAGFAYVGAGWRLFVAWLPLVAFVFFGMGLVGAIAGIAAWTSARGGANADVLEGIMIGAILVIYAGILLFSGLATVVAPAINFLHIVDGERFSGVAFKRQWELMKEGGTQYLLLFVAILLAGLVAQLGIFAFFIGILITAPYAQAMQGVALAEFGRVLRPSSAGFKIDGSVGGASGTPFGVTL